MGKVTLPEPYVDCVLVNKDGTKRIGRLDNKKDCWLLSSYHRCKNQYCWSLDEVIAFKIIDFDD